MLEIKNLTMEYPKSRGVKNINLQIEKGQVVGLLGENGAGKTTLLKLIVGIYKGKKGSEILFSGEKLSPTIYNDIAYISEELGLFDDWTIDEHRDFYQLAYENFNVQRFNKLVDFFYLNGYMGKVKTFSKGQKAKLELTIGFSKSAKYIFMDEPFLGNDALTRSDFLKIMSSFITEDDIIIIASHQLEEIEQFLDRGIFIKNGEIKENFTADEITEQGGLIEISKNVFDYDSTRIQKIL